MTIGTVLLRRAAWTAKTGSWAVRYARMAGDGSCGGGGGGGGGSGASGSSGMTGTSVAVRLPDGRTYEQPTGLFIDNEFCKGSGRFFETVDPSTGSVICAVHEALEEDVNLAVVAARRAFDDGGAWAAFAPADRGRCLARLADLLEADREILGAIEALDGGKPLAAACDDDCTETVSVLRYYAGFADKIHGRVIDTGVQRLAYTLHEPVGVCGQIIPWNFPLSMFAWKVAPALACGNTVVLKTAEQTPLSALYACTKVAEAGFPPGVINVISGFGKTAGQALVEHADVDKIAFTGSTATGRLVARTAAAGLKKLTLELGGKSPCIVFADADLEQAVRWSHHGMFSNMGQVCSATSRLYVQNSLLERFVKEFVDATQRRRVGGPFQEGTYQGPQISKAQYEKVQTYIELGISEGANLAYRGKDTEHDGGFFVQPAIFTQCKPNMRIVKEEIFGPCCVILGFDTEEEVIAAANDTSYGLAAAIFTKDITRGHRLARKLQAGTVWINSSGDGNVQIPFGGFKKSGLGRELGEYALEHYIQVKAVCVNLGD